MRLDAPFALRGSLGLAIIKKTVFDDRVSFTSGLSSRQMLSRGALSTKSSTRVDNTIINFGGRIWLACARFFAHIEAGSTEITFEQVRVYLVAVGRRRLFAGAEHELTIAKRKMRVPKKRAEV